MPELPVEDSASLAESRPDPGGAPFPEHLPPVEPPSAGFIVQLFLVPALIVMAIVGVWALFGKLAAEDADIAQVLGDLRSANEHRRGPSMLRLAQLLQIDAERDRTDRQYVANPQVASETAAVLEYWMEQSPGNADQKLKALETEIFLARSLGWFHTPDAVLPVLHRAVAIEPEPRSGDRQEQAVRELQLEVRKAAIASVAAVVEQAGPGEAVRIAQERPELLETLIDASAEPDEEPVIRQLGTFALGMFPVTRAQAQLQALLIHADPKTRLNAAIALARQGSPAGYGVFEDTLHDGGGQAGPTSAADQQGAREFERFIALKNAIRAVGELAEELEASQRRRLAQLLAPIAEGHPLHEIRQAAVKSSELLTGQL